MLRSTCQFAHRLTYPPGLILHHLYLSINFHSCQSLYNHHFIATNL